MKIWSIALCLTVSSLLMSCEKIKPLSSVNPMVGEWRLSGWQEYHLPMWYVAAVPLKSSDYIITPTDTIYGDILAFTQGVRSFTLSVDNALSEKYYTPNHPKSDSMHIDIGRWSVRDTTVNFQVNNSLFHQAFYRYATDELVVNKVSQSGIYTPTGLMKDTMRVNYILVAHYIRDN